MSAAASSGAIMFTNDMVEGTTEATDLKIAVAVGRRGVDQGLQVGHPSSQVRDQTGALQVHHDRPRKGTKKK